MYNLEVLSNTTPAATTCFSKNCRHTVNHPQAGFKTRKLSQLPGMYCWGVVMGMCSRKYCTEMGDGSWLHGQHAIEPVQPKLWEIVIHAEIVMLEFWCCSFDACASSQTISYASFSLQMRPHARSKACHPTSDLRASNFSLKLLAVCDMWLVAGMPTAAHNLQEQKVVNMMPLGKASRLEYKSGISIVCSKPAIGWCC